MSELHKIRYLFEQSALPGLFYEDTYKIITDLLYIKDAAFILFDSFCNTYNFKNPYTKSQFETKLINISSDYIACQINMPIPAEIPQSHRIYLRIDADCEVPSYYTVEKSTHGQMIFCGIGSDGTHYSYDTVSSYSEELKHVKGE